MSRRRLSRAAVVSGLFLALLAAPAAAQTTTVAHDAHTIFAGTVVGSFAETHDEDGQVQAISEWKTSNNPNKQTSAAEHHYMLDLPAGAGHTFFVKATATDNGEGDDWKFLWSIDDQNFTEFLLFPEGGTSLYQSASLPAGLSGIVHIAVKDADRTKRNATYDTIAIDHLYVDTVSGGPPGAPAAPSDLNARSWSSSSVNMTWTDNATDEDGFRIERWNGGNWLPVGTVGADVTEFGETGLSAATTYEYQVCAFNSAGDSNFSNIDAVATWPESPWVTEMVDLGAWLGTEGRAAHDYDPLSGFPVIGYHTGGTVRIAGWDGASWNVEIVTSDGGYHVDMAFSPSGKIGLAYFRTTPKIQIRFAEKTVSGWTLEQVQWKAVPRPSIAYDSSDRATVAYRGRDLKLGVRQGTDSWQDELITTSRAESTSLAYDLQGRPAIAYAHDINDPAGGYSNSLGFAHWNGSSWDVEIIEAGVAFGVDCSLAYDPITGWPAIVHGTGPAGLRFVRWDGSAWQAEVLGANGNGSLAYDAAGTPHVAWHDADNTLMYAYWNGAAWSYEFVNRPVHNTPQIAIGPTGVPSISCRGGSPSGPGLTFARRQGSGQ